MALSDVSGRVLAENLMQVKYGQIDVSEIPAGVYFLTFVIEAEVKVYKIVIQR